MSTAKYSRHAHIDGPGDALECASACTLSQEFLLLDRIHEHLVPVTTLHHQASMSQAVVHKALAKLRSRVVLSIDISIALL